MGIHLQKIPKRRSDIAPPTPYSVLAHAAIPPHRPHKARNDPSWGWKGLQQQSGVKQGGRISIPCRLDKIQANDLDETYFADS